MTTSPIIVLIRPQLGENIGAVARAMSNFGLSELRIVAPRDGWPNEAAVAMAAGAASIIHAAKLFDATAEALSDIQHVYATTARPRDMMIRVVEPAEAMGEMASGAEKCAILFGPERTGLANEDMGWARTIITIPTAENASLNIAQSAVVMGYEWWCMSSRPTEGSGGILRSLDFARDDKSAPIAHYDAFFRHLEQGLDEANFFKVPEKKPSAWLSIKTIFLRAGYSEQELRTLFGMVRALTDKK